MKIAINKIKPNPNNPRVIRDAKFDQLCDSLRVFPKMLEIRPIVVDENMMILGGNQRYAAAKAIGLETIEVKKAEDLTEDEKREFIIKDNLPYGEWNWDDLKTNWDVEKLEEWGLDVPSFETNDIDISDKLSETFKIEISCADEQEQEKVYNELIAVGLKCRLLSL